jgi:hypothetical protein
MPKGASGELVSHVVLGVDELIVLMSAVGRDYQPLGLFIAVLTAKQLIAKRRKLNVALFLSILF